MPDDNRTQRPSNDAPRDPLDDLIAPILGRDIAPEPRNAPTLPETSKQSRRNPLDDLVTDAELRVEASKAAARSVALNQGRRNPLDDLPRDAELRTESRKSPATSKPVPSRVGRRILKSIPVSMFVVVGLLLVAIGVLIGEHLAQNKNEQVAVVNPSSAISREELWKRANEPREEFPKTFETPDENLDLQEPQRFNDGEDAPEVIKRRVMRPVSPPPKLEAESLPARASRAVVRIMIRNARSRVIGQGSGFFVRDDATVITNFHVVECAHSAEVVLHDGTSLPVLGIQGFDPVADVAVLKIEPATRAIHRLTLGPNELPQLGRHIHVLGWPQQSDEQMQITSLTPVFTSGEVNAHIEQRGRLWIQISAPINRGSSGSPVLNSDDGSVIGIATSYIGGLQNVNFASPASGIKSLLVGDSKLHKLSDLADEKKRILDSVRESLEKDGADAAAGKLDGLTEPESFQKLPEFWILKGDICSNRTQWVAALTAFSKALKLDSEDSQIWCRIGITYRRLQQDAEAEEAFLKGTQLNEKDEKCWLELGRSRRFTKRPREAKEALLRCLEINQENAWAHKLLGDVLEQLGDNAGAIDEHEAALRIDSRHYFFHVDYGALLLKIGRHREAIKAFENGLRLAKTQSDRELCEELLHEARRQKR